MTLTLPGGWRKSEEQEDWLRLQGPDNLQVVLGAGEWLGAPTPQEALEKQYEARLAMQGEGALSGVRYLELGSLKGVFWRDTTQVRNSRYSHLNWHAYRERGGRLYLVRIALEGPTDAFAAHEKALYEILNSIKFKPEAGPSRSHRPRRPPP